MPMKPELVIDTPARLAHVFADRFATLAREVIAELELRVADSYVSPGAFAWIYVALKEYDEAFAWWAKAVDGCDPAAIWLPV